MQFVFFGPRLKTEVIYKMSASVLHVPLRHTGVTCVTCVTDSLRNRPKYFSETWYDV